MDVRKGKDGTEWVLGVGGLHLGRGPSGTIRVAMTNGLHPLDGKAEPTYHEFQPKDFERLAAWALGSAEAVRDARARLSFPFEIVENDVVLKVSDHHSFSLRMLAEYLGGQTGEAITARIDALIEAA